MSRQKKSPSKISPKTQKHNHSQMTSAEALDAARYQFLLEQRSLIEFLGAGLSRVIEDLIKMGDEYGRRVIELQKLSVEVVNNVKQSNNTIN